MATVERVIPPKIAEDGSVHYSSVMSPPDDSIAVCYMVPNRVIPVIFVPGVMGSNLMNAKTKKPIWVVNGKGSIAVDWIGRGPATRKQKLDPAATDVYDGGDIPGGTAKSKMELKACGWGTVARMSYGTFLSMLENALDDAAHCEGGLRAQLMREQVASSPGVSVLSHDEVDLSYRYQLPVHAVGYNWLKSNADSAAYLAEKIRSIIESYRKQKPKKICEKVILVTHSMGGLVARYYSEVDGNRDNVLGIVHGVMPTTGSATAYKRVTAGTDGTVGLVLGSSAATMTPVFAQAPGPLQLLPSAEYGAGWLRICDGAKVFALPKCSSSSITNTKPDGQRFATGQKQGEPDPYGDIYTQRGVWWALVNDKLINPLDENKTNVNPDWAQYIELIWKHVKPFHEAMTGKFHATTYAFYGDDKKFATWGEIIWKRVMRSGGLYVNQNDPITDLMTQPLLADSGTGTKSVGYKMGRYKWRADFVLGAADENGDGTVPIRSGQAPEGHPGVFACVPYPNVDHEGAYQGRTQQLFALWAITRIVKNVKGTALEYKE